MRSYRMAALVVSCVCFAASAYAQLAPVDPDTALEGLLKTMASPTASENARLLRTPEGYVRFIGAPPGGHFSTEASASKSAVAPDAVARSFISQHPGAFGAGSLKEQFVTERLTASDGRNYVRLQQTYSSFIVFGAQMLVQLDAENGIASIASDIMRDPGKLDSGEVPLSPTISTNTAETNAIGYVAGQKGIVPSKLTSTAPTRMVFDPEVVGAPGELCVVFELIVYSKDDYRIIERVFVNAKDGAVVFSYPLLHDLKNRKIYDAQSIFPPANVLLRAEGDPPTGMSDADLAYDYFGDTYDFYYQVHNRDSIDGLGIAMLGVVNFCFPGECPMANAFYLSGLPEGYSYGYGLTGDTMYFGAGYASADDVVAHELTHGVTDYTSQLIYSYESGAINESFSDIWGEYVDLVNGRGTDTEGVRWLMGEDLPDGAIRNMKDPTQFGDPDRVGSPYYYYGTADNGGVHWNSGVINKLCYLLTDGGDFNGQTVTATGIEKTAKLFYECQANLLTESSDFADLYMALGQATVNQAYAFEQRLNVRAAARAVEIVPSWLDEDLRLFRAVPAFTTRNRPVIALYWDLPSTASLRQVILVRSTGAYPRTPAEGFEVYRGLGEKFLDETGITAGVTYYYALFADVLEGFPSAVYARATAGTQPSDYLTEEFERIGLPGATNPFDLSFCQILFSPTGPPTASLGSSGGSGDYNNYTVTVRKSVYEFPVPRGTGDNAAYKLDLTEDGGVWAGNVAYQEGALKQTFPFFQHNYSQVFVSANGYIAFERVYSNTSSNFPSYAAHFNVPRISYLFSDLAPKIGGEVWAKSMNDRFVVTVEYMPEWLNYVNPPSSSPNSVQVELFYSGHIRITYGTVNVNTAIVGLSDGRGVPRDPADLFQNLQPASFVTDFSLIASTPTALSIAPVTPPMVKAGEVAEFDARATWPTALGFPALWAEWDRDGFPNFLDEGNGRGHFRWETGVEDYGEYTVRVYAQLGEELAYQDVRLWVDLELPLPTATNLGIRTNNPIEDPMRSRTVSDETELIALYAYSHPLQYLIPELFEEGATQILWFQNQAFIFANQPVVAPHYTKPNDRWFFKVLPTSLSGEQGVYATSPVVTILSLPEILDVIRIEDLPPDEIYPEDLPLPGVPIAWGPSSGGSQVAIFGRKLRNVTSVKVGGIEAQSVHGISDSRIDIVTPAHLPSPVVGGTPVPETLVVTTTAGTSGIPDAFVYVASGEAISKADVNQDGVVDAVDVQLVINAVLSAAKSTVDADVNRDGKTNSVDIQAVINEALGV